MIPLRDDQIEYFMRKAYQAGLNQVEFIEVVNEMRIWLLQQTQYVRDEQIVRYQRYDDLAIKDLKPGQVIRVDDTNDFPNGPYNVRTDFADQNPSKVEYTDPDSFEIGLDSPRQVAVDLEEVEER